MKFTLVEFIQSVREQYEELKGLYLSHDEKISYPDFEAALEYMEKYGAAPDQIALEKQYAEQLVRLTQLCDEVCPWVINHGKLVPIKVAAVADEIMDYVDAVRP